MDFTPLLLCAQARPELTNHGEYAIITTELSFSDLIVVCVIDRVPVYHVQSLKTDTNTTTPDSDNTPFSGYIINDWPNNWERF